MVEYSIGSTCYLRCYIINMLMKEEVYDTIGLQSLFLDDVFKYKYNYLNMIRDGVNLAVEPCDVYKVPFNMDDKEYELLFRIGYDNRLGLLENFDRKGEILIPLHSNKIQECYNITTVLYRFAMFMISQSGTPFKQITLYKNEMKVGWFYCSMVSKDSFSVKDSFFYEFDVMKYIPKILNNIALDSGNKITQSIPLGHLGNFDSMFSPMRFVEQIMSFEYLFYKLEPDKAKQKKFPLKKELAYMFDKFPKLLSNNNLSSDEVSEKIKEIRRTIVHGYSYYYDFKDDFDIKRLIILLDRLILNMSLLYIGFSEKEIEKYSVY